MFGMPGAIVPCVILTYLMTGASAGAVFFLLIFLGVLTRERHIDHVRRDQQRKGASLTLVMLDRYRDKNRAA